MDFDIHFIAYFETGQLQKCGIEDDSLRVTDF
jgi:hypothetical protein